MDRQIKGRNFVEGRRFMNKIKNLIVACFGIFREDSPASMSRVGFVVLLVTGIYHVNIMIGRGVDGLQIAAVAGAYFTAATALKTISKKYEGGNDNISKET